MKDSQVDRDKERLRDTMRERHRGETQRETHKYKGVK